MLKVNLQIKKQIVKGKAAALSTRFEIPLSIALVTMLQSYK